MTDHSAAQVNTGGGAYVHGDVNVPNGDFIGRDQIIYKNIEVIYNRAVSDAEEARQRRDLERSDLAEGVIKFANDLKRRMTNSADTGGPYRGLLNYRLSDASLFEGRAMAIEAMLTHILGRDALSSLVVLHAESGAGKTSLIQAGLSPRLLEQGYLPLYVRAWQDSPTHALKRLVMSNIEEIPRGLSQASLRSFLAQVAQILGPDAITIVFLDQFEEFFRLRQELRDQFIAELSECLSDETLPVRFVISLRDDSFGQIGSFEPPIRYPCANQYLLAPLKPQEARDAIVEPASRAGISYAEGLADRILAELATPVIAPPQLQLVCEALFRNLTPGESTITEAMYDRLEGVAGILKQYVDQVLKRDLPPERRRLAKGVLSGLITPEGRRDRKSRDGLARQLGLSGANAAQLDTVLTELVQSRLLRKVNSGELLEQEDYELVHDYLIDVIRPRDENQRLLLISALQEGVDITPLVQQIGTRAVEWIREIWRDEAQPESLQLAAAGALGQLEDEDTFNELKQGSVQALARFVGRSRRARPISPLLWLRVERQLAILRLRDSTRVIAGMGRSGGLIGVLVALLTTGYQFRNSPYLTTFLIAVLFSACAYALTTLMTRFLIAAQAIIARQAAWIQVSVMAMTGSITGFIAMLPALFSPYGLAAGAVIGLAWAYVYGPAPKARLTTRVAVPFVTGIVSALACLVCMVLFGKFTAPNPNLPDITLTLLGAGLFAGLVIWRAASLRLQQLA